MHRSAISNKLFKPPEYRLINNKVVKFADVAVHEFSIGDVDDPDLYAAVPLYKWQQSEAGKWIMDHAVETPHWQRVTDPHTFGYRYRIVARLREQDQTYWTLKWQKS
jgi:hypothetical protein